MPSLDSMTFDTTGWQFDPTFTDRRVWRTPEGDGIVLHHFAKPPDLPAGLRSVDDLREFYLGMTRGTPTTLVEVKLVTVAGHRAVLTVVKVRQQPTGMTYVGSLTLPFRDFSFVVKGQCPERGTTGMREAVLFDRLFREGKVKLDPKAGVVGGMNADDEQYDAEFPAHPLSRLRRLMRHVEATATVDPDTAAAASFPLPQT